MYIKFDENLIEKYINKTPYSKKLYEDAIKVTPGGVQSSFRWFPPYPFYVEKAVGAYIWDVDGNKYFDYIMGYGALIAGHSPQPIVEAISEQILRGTLYTAPYELQINLIKELLKRYPGLDGFKISNTGTEAVMHAIKMARVYTGREKIIKIEGTYHGGYDPVKVSEYSRPSNWGDPSRPNPVLGSGVPKFYSEQVYVVQFNDVENLEKLVEEHKDEIAAMIIEPVMMNNVGMVKPLDGYLNKVERILKRNEIVFIVDEVKTGFRLGYGGAVEYFNLNPDIVVLAKALGGGVPISAVGFTRELGGVIYPEGRYAFSGTYNGNHLVVSVAFLNLTKILSKSAHRKLFELGEKFGRGLDEISQKVDIDITPSYIGPAGAIHFMSYEPRNFRDVILNYNFKLYRDSWVEMMNKGLLLRGPVDGEPYFISLAHTEQDLYESLDIIEKVLTKKG